MSFFLFNLFNSNQIGGGGGGTLKKSKVLIIRCIIVKTVKTFATFSRDYGFVLLLNSLKNTETKIRAAACVRFAGTHAVFLLLHLLKQFLGPGMELEHIKPNLPQSWG